MTSLTWAKRLRLVVTGNAGALALIAEVKSSLEHKDSSNFAINE
jgi:hypothetical protein